LVVLFDETPTDREKSLAEHFTESETCQEDKCNANDLAIDNHLSRDNYKIRFL